MLDTLRIFFSSSIANLNVYDILILVLFMLSLILTIVFSVILLATKVRQLDNDVASRIDENIELDKTILGYLDILVNNAPAKAGAINLASSPDSRLLGTNKQKQLEEQISNITNIKNRDDIPVATTLDNLSATPYNMATALPPALPVPATEQDIASLQNLAPKTLLAANAMPQLQEKDVSLQNNNPVLEANLSNKKLFDELAKLEQKILQQQEETRKLQILDRERLLKQQSLNNVNSTLSEHNSSPLPADSTIYNPNAYNKKFEEVTLHVLDNNTNKNVPNQTLASPSNTALPSAPYNDSYNDDFDDDYIDDLPMVRSSASNTIDSPRGVSIENVNNRATTTSETTNRARQAIPLGNRAIPRTNRSEPVDRSASTRSLNEPRESYDTNEQNDNERTPRRSTRVTPTRPTSATRVTLRSRIQNSEDVPNIEHEESHGVRSRYTPALTRTDSNRTSPRMLESNNAEDRNLQPRARPLSNSSRPNNFTNSSSSSTFSTNNRSRPSSPSTQGKFNEPLTSAPRLGTQSATPYKPSRNMLGNQGAPKPFAMLGQTLPKAFPNRSIGSNTMAKPSFSAQRSTQTPLRAGSQSPNRNTFGAINKGRPARLPIR